MNTPSHWADWLMPEHDPIVQHQNLDPYDLLELGLEAAWPLPMPTPAPRLSTQDREFLEWIH